MTAPELLPDQIAALREVLNPATNELLSDHDCMRFLRARQMNLEKAAEMSNAWGVWVQTPLPGSAQGRTPLTILEDIDDPNEDFYARLCPHCITGEDREGRPIFWEKTGICAANYSVLKKDLNNDTLIARHIWIQSLMGCRLKQMSEKHGRKIEKTNIVFDMNGLQFSPDMDSIRYSIAILQTDQNYFPETLNSIFIINAPWYFTAIYALVTPFMDAVTKAKFRIYGSDYFSALVENIAEDFIPVDYGGKLEVRWSFPYPDLSHQEIIRLRGNLQSGVKVSGTESSNCIEDVNA
jgi:hypothetical protein